MRVTSLKPKLADTSNSGCYRNLKGEPIAEVLCGQTFECQDEKARELIRLGYVMPYEVPNVAYEVTMFSGMANMLPIETKEADRPAERDGDHADEQPAEVHPSGDQPIPEPDLQRTARTAHRQRRA